MTSLKVLREKLAWDGAMRGGVPGSRLSLVSVHMERVTVEWGRSGNPLDTQADAATS